MLAPIKLTSGNDCIQPLQQLFKRHEPPLARVPGTPVRGSIPQRLSGLQRVGHALLRGPFAAE